MFRARPYLRELGLVPRERRFTPRKPREAPWTGRVVALDTEGSADTGRYTATAQWDNIHGETFAQRFDRPDRFAEFLIDQASMKSPVLFYFHNLEWDLQVMWAWLGYGAHRTSRLEYESHTARRNGSALSCVWTWDNRPEHARKITIRDSFAIWPLSLARLGDVVGLPKYRTPRVYLPHIVNWRDGSLIEPHEEHRTDAPPCDAHTLDECPECYDHRDAAILHTAMRLYIDECNAASIAPALTRSAHAMRDYRTNHLPEALHQYTERENLRALAARYGARTQMIAPGLTVAPEGHTILQPDVASMYPSIMASGRFPDAGMHHVLHRPRTDRVRTYVGHAWASVTIPPMPLGPLIYRHENGRTDYPSDVTIQGAWTTDELAYALDLGCTMRIVRLEGTPDHATIDPFTTFVDAKITRRLALKAAGNPLHEAEKLSLNGLSGKFGMRWTEPIVAFVATTEPTTIDALLHATPCERADKMPVRVPDYIMIPWSSIILARARIRVHEFAQRLINAGGTLLTCDTDSWAVCIPENALPGLPFGHGLGEWEDDGKRYHAFRGAAPKEYALYTDARELFACEPSKARAKGIGSLGLDEHERAIAIDHYLRTGSIHYQRPQKTRSVLRGAPMATFLPQTKERHTRVEYPIPAPLPFDEFAAAVRDDVRHSETRRLHVIRIKESPPAVTVSPEGSPKTEKCGA